MRSIMSVKNVLFAAVFIILFQTAPLSASEAEMSVAAGLGGMLIEQFQPEKLEVTVSNGGSFVYAEATGAVIEDMRVEKIRVEAMMKEPPRDIRIEKKYELADLIYFSKGEVVLLEKDVNDYFVKNFEDIKGFTNMRCDFSTRGFSASGTFTAKFIFTFSVNLKATGVLSLRSDGIYLDDTEFFISNVKQPQYIAGQILKEVNPLLEFKEDIPFPVSLKKLTMTDTKVVATGYPKRFSGGEAWSYSR